MKANGLAKVYLKYWHQDGRGDWRMADNAPSPLVMCVKSLPATVTRNMFYEGLSIVAGNPKPERSLAMLLEWLANNQSAASFCDTALKSKRVPPTLAELVEKAYANELQTVRNHITTCLDRVLLT